MDSEYLSSLFILLGLCGIPLALPIIFGSLILKGFWKDEVSRLAGFFVLKPILAFPIYIFIWEDRIWGTFFPLMLYLLLTLCIVFLFRDILKENSVARYFLLGDIASWLIATIFWIFLNRIGLIVAELFLPTIYATVSLLYIYNRSNKLKRENF